MKEEKYNIIEGMLYLAGDEGIDAKLVSDVLTLSRKDATVLLDEFVEFYSNKASDGIVIVNHGGYFKLATNPKYIGYYQKMVEQSKASLSNAALETLAIIAYNQPITRSEIEDIRGVGCDAMIRKLIAKALIKDVGRKDAPGLPILYGVTKEFMDAFGLASLDELPDLQDVVEIETDQDLFETKYREEGNDEITETSQNNHEA